MQPSPMFGINHSFTFYIPRGKMASSMQSMVDPRQSRKVRVVAFADRFLPAEAPLDMPTASLERAATPRILPTDAKVLRRRATVFWITGLVVVGLASVMVAGLMRDGVSIGDVLILAFFVPNIAWTAFAAATAVCGAFWDRARGKSAQRESLPRDWRPRRRTAVLIPARNEAVDGLARRIDRLRHDLARQGLTQTVDIFVLSDSAENAAEAEERMALGFATDGAFVPPVYYRRRTDNARRKPGNLSEWVERFGAAYAYMLILDADSRMTGARVAGLIHRMETNPGVGLIQTGVRLVGAQSRFARLQQLATRLYGGAFASGIAGWSGAEGNYWGHNALVRVRAFAGAAGLPALGGAAPFGGEILSHDFIEAAWLRRAGWAIEIEPDSRGSAEGGPESLLEYSRRDRRWCQGNLQHLRVLATARGLHPVSKLHLACGIAGYLAAPMWLGLVVTAILAGPSGALILPVLGAMGLILAQKLAGIAIWFSRRPGARTRRIVLRQAAGELLASTLLAPIVMVRQTVSVASVLSGRDCGWKPAGGAGRRGSGTMRWLEPAVGLGLAAAVLPGTGDLWQLAMLTPILLPLLTAPMLAVWLDRTPRRMGVAQDARPAMAAVVEPMFGRA